MPAPIRGGSISPASQGYRIWNFRALRRGRRLGFRHLWSSLGRRDAFVRRKLGRRGSNAIALASIGVGSSFHLALEQINAKAGVSMTHIPFRGGGQAVPELLAGRLDAMFASWSLARAHVQAGSVRPLATA